MRKTAIFLPRCNTRVRHLGVSEAHRNDILKCLVTSLVQNERIVTTLAKAKEMRRYVERTITAAKRGDIPQQEWAQYLSNPGAIEKVKTLLAERYRNRPGGYVRVLKNGFRFGDGAPRAIVELVDSPNSIFSHPLYRNISPEENKT
ncbi:50S ribosomal protein L17 [Galdieria sulphuraria]|uniref:50S ribosomal protein L17 (Mitochondrial) n=1 Tax=Galdieria sulphuraria TaxID=130081 RepID=M2XRL9_GALSU|nr:50S ribosomal protein L17 (mitochondrial) [Galdieria sulphuraria]EME32877.1 50S ribosomal protein L17 (mitochondrial) [Galdieria sulphuraria]GJD05745.1 50S ribosomal protein L17 [Galdieria sulphuraria]|eukprot:XP_005709397.1 50S ribosomal protein L17 (mitochondrial) [Galdieria sulphuraria]